MKVPSLLTCAMAALALAACNKNKNDGGNGPAATNETVSITQANPPPGGTWADVVNATSAGGYMMGNPNAKVKLIEIGSLSCPHCKAFEDEGMPTLVEKYVKPGTVSWEFRPYIIHGPIDMAANLIARCNGVKTFFPFVQALYKDQDSWLGKVQTTPQGKLAQIQNLPPNQLFVQMASVLGLQDWAAERGLPQAKSNQCLSDQKMINDEVQHTSDVNAQYPQFQGTPAFVINGKMLADTAGWDKLKPQLEDAVK
ncbi:MAG TPA: thioredoxin domain-containing protein [Sphingomicrobium sp.]|nr:thioredoxin domain-containing protein [Sphingomicrobium sp.]